ncbi:MAG: aminopeptidase P family protein [Bacteroidales bacterium]
MFTKEIYIERRKKLAADVKSGVLLFLGNDESGMNYLDNTYTFRQDSTFLYFFGLDYAGLNAIIDIDENKEIIFGNELTVDDIVWTGVQPSLKENSAKIGVQNTLPTSELKKYLNKAKASGRKIHFLNPYRGDHSIKYLELLGIKPAQQKELVSVDFIKAIVKQRIYKSAAEVAEIEKACTISANMHIKMMQMLRPGVTEMEVAAAVTEIAQREGGQLSFPNIATIHGQTLHQHSQTNTVSEGDLFLLDAGAETRMHYAGDESSTCCVSKHFSERQKTIFNICLNAHMAAVHALKPGIPFKEVHLIAGTEIARGMKELGLVKGDPRAVAESGAYAMFFPCGLGHMMGLDVHDMENMGEVYVGYDGKPKSTQFGFKSLRLGRPLEPGFVLTIEPGIYFIPELIDQWRAEKRFSEFLNYEEINKFRDFGGLRNEEDYLITETGYKRLGKYKPMTIKEIEALR